MKEMIMKRALLTAAAGLAAIALAPAAQAAVYIPGDPQFQVTGDISNGTVSANIGHSGIAKTETSDQYFFVIGQTGVGSGGVITTATKFHATTDLDILSVFVNGMAATALKSPNGLFESFSINAVPIIAGATNEIIVNYLSRGNGSYGGNITFTPNAVPEAATWAMMLIGFGAVGTAMRYRRRQPKVSFA